MYHNILDLVHLLLEFLMFSNLPKNIASHSQWPSILMNLPHFGHTVKGRFWGGESSSVSLEDSSPLSI